jgi:hypothetical protein
MPNTTYYSKDHYRQVSYLISQFRGPGATTVGGKGWGGGEANNTRGPFVLDGRGDNLHTPLECCIGVYSTILQQASCCVATPLNGGLTFLGSERRGGGGCI